MSATMGQYLGLHSLGFSLGITLGPALRMALLQQRGGPALWTSVAVICLLIAFLFWRISMEWDGNPSETS